MKQLLSFIHAHYGEHINIDDIAQAAAIIFRYEINRQNVITVTLCHFTPNYLYSLKACTVYLSSHSSCPAQNLQNSYAN